MSISFPPLLTIAYDYVPPVESHLSGKFILVVVLDTYIATPTLCPLQGMTGEADRVPGGHVNDDHYQASDDSAGDGEGGGGIKIII